MADVGAPRQQGQRRRKQEKRDLPLCIEADDLRQDREGRVVDDNSAFRIGLVQIVPVRMKRAKKRGGAELVLFAHPFGDCFVDLRRRVAVVGGLLRLELLLEGLILRIVIEESELIPVGAHTSISSAALLSRSLRTA